LIAWFHRLRRYASFCFILAGGIKFNLVLHVRSYRLVAFQTNRFFLTLYANAQCTRSNVLSPSADYTRSRAFLVLRWSNFPTFLVTEPSPLPSLLLAIFVSGTTWPFWTPCPAYTPKRATHTDLKRNLFFILPLVSLVNPFVFPND